MATPLRRIEIDSWDVPAGMIPSDLSYQWCAKRINGEFNSQFDVMLNGGWIPVPRARHPDLFSARCENAAGEIEKDGQVLMSRLKETSTEARAVEQDKAFGNVRRFSGGGTNESVVRLVRIEVPVLLNSWQADAAQNLRWSNERYAKWLVSHMLESRESQTVLKANIEAAALVPTHQDRRIPRHRLLAWLFNLISVEDKT